MFDALFERATRDRDASGAAAVFAADDDVTMWGSDETEREVGPYAVRAHTYSSSGLNAPFRTPSSVTAQLSKTELDRLASA